MAFHSPATRMPRSGLGTRKAIGSLPASPSTAADSSRWVALGNPVKNVLTPSSRQPPSTGSAVDAWYHQLPPDCGSEKPPASSAPSVTTCRRNGSARSRRNSARMPTPCRCMFTARAVAGEPSARRLWAATRSSGRAPRPPRSRGTVMAV